MLYDEIIPNYIYSKPEKIISDVETINGTEYLIYTKLSVPHKSNVLDYINSKLENDVIEGEVFLFEDEFNNRSFRKSGSDYLSTALLNLPDDVFSLLHKKNKTLEYELDEVMNIVGLDDKNNKDRIIIQNSFLINTNIIESIVRENPEYLHEAIRDYSKFSGHGERWFSFIMLSDGKLPSRDDLFHKNLFSVEGDYISPDSIDNAVDLLYSNHVDVSAIKYKEKSSQILLDKKAAEVINFLNDYKQSIEIRAFPNRNCPKMYSEIKKFLN